MKERTFLSGDLAAELIALGVGGVILTDIHEGVGVAVLRDDIAPLVRFLRQHFPEQVAEGMKEPPCE